MNNQINKKKISVFGLGKLGVPVVACLLSKGFEVIGVDLDENKVQLLKKLKSPVYEPEVQELLNSCGKLLKVTSDGEYAVLNSDITFIIVSTPSKNDGSFSNQYVLAASEVIGKILRKKESYHLVSVTSTVFPGSMENEIKPCIEKFSNKKAGIDFGLCYNPEFIALGSVVHDFLNPSFVLIGESDPTAGKLLSGIYKVICENNPPIERMNLICAELTKLALNTYVTTKISFANMIARICEKIPGADVDVITSTLSKDVRVGKGYLKGAVSYGGPCFPRDNVALNALAKKIGISADIAEASDRYNRSQIKLLADLTESYLPKGGIVGILGLAYKPGTNVTEESVGVLLAKELALRKIPTIGYDPLGNENSKNILGDKIRLLASSQECIKSSDVVVLTTPWKEFSEIQDNEWVRDNSPRVVIDCWRVLKHLSGNKRINYIPLGKIIK